MIQGRDFLSVRDFLYGLPGEASTRTRTSRAYYAAFHESLAYFEAVHSFRRRRHSADHAAVVEALIGIDAGVAANLDNLRRLRNMADYDLELGPEVILEDAMWAGRLVQVILTRLDEIGGT